MTYPINKGTCGNCQYCRLVVITESNPNYVGMEEEYYTCDSALCPKRTCTGCKYYATCGDPERTEPCNGWDW